MRRGLFRIGAGILILGAMVHVATLWPRVTALAASLPARAWIAVAGYGVSAATALAACALALFLLWKAADRTDARALTLFLGFMAVFWGSLFRFLTVETSPDSVSVNFQYGGGWISQSASASFVLAVAAFLRFTSLFPGPLIAGRLPRSRWPRAFRTARSAFLRPAVVWVGAIAVLVVLRLVPSLVARLVGLEEQAAGPLPRTFVVSLIAAGVILIAYTLGSMSLGAVNLRDSYRLAVPAERKRILWVVAGFSAASWMLVGAFGLVLLMATAGLDFDKLGIVIPLAIVFSPLVLVVSATVGILYSGAIDPGLALQKSTLYGILGALGVVAFAAIENALSDLVEQRLELPGFVGAMLAGGVVTAMLVPLRALLRRAMARRTASLGAALH